MAKLDVSVKIKETWARDTVKPQIPAIVDAVADEAICDDAAAAGE